MQKTGLPPSERRYTRRCVLWGTFRRQILHRAFRARFAFEGELWSDEPRSTSEGWIMLDRILLATDLSEESASAWHIAIALAQRSTRPALCVLHIFDIPSAYVDIDGAGLVPRLYEDSRRSAEEEMRRYGALCRASGIEMRPVERLGNPVESIVKTARDENAELIVLGIRHAGVIDRLLGRSIVGQVARMAPCHVLCVKPR